jgi:hypothetical protein
VTPIAIDDSQQAQQHHPQALSRNRSAASATSGSPLQNCPSHDSSHHRPPYGNNGNSSISRRKKPLAVAVGFNYAEDPKGRPIVITPTTPTNLVNNNNINRPPSIANSPSVATAVTANTSVYAPPPHWSIWRRRPFPIVLPFPEHAIHRLI